MPWTPEDATSHTKMAMTETAKRLWAEIANQVLAKTGDEGRAVRDADTIIARTVGNIDRTALAALGRKHSALPACQRSMRRAFPTVSSGVHK